MGPDGGLPGEERMLPREIHNLLAGLCACPRFEAHYRFREKAGGEARFGLACARGELRELIHDTRLNIEPVELFDDWRFFLH